MRNIHRVFIVFMLLMLPVSALATDISISGFQSISNYQYPGSTVYLRIFSSDTFTTSDGRAVVGTAVGSTGFYQQITCTITSNIVTCPSFVLPSTVDGSRPSAGFTGVFFDTHGNQKETLFTKWHLDKQPNAITYKDWEAYQPTPHPPLGDDFYNKAQIDAKYSGLSTAPDASDGIKGRVRLKTAPASSTDPVVPGDNDPRLAPASTDNRGTVTTTTSSSTAVSTDDARLGGLINAKSKGAVCNGTTDDTTAIRAAITAAQTAGTGIYVPGSANGCLVGTTTGTEILLVTKPIAIMGDGFNSKLVVKTTTPSTIDVLRYKPANVAVNNEGFKVIGITFMSQATVDNPANAGEYTANPTYCARHTLVLDSSAAPTARALEKIYIANNQFLPISSTGRAIYAFGGNANGTPAKTEIVHNLIYGGTYLPEAGDSVLFAYNKTLSDFSNPTPFPALSATQVAGATQLMIIGNNMTDKGGGVYVGRGVNLVLRDNIIELYKAGSAGINGAVVDLEGGVGQIENARIDNNVISSLLTVSLHALQIEAVTVADLNLNRFYTPDGKNGINIVAGSGAMVYLGNDTQAGAGNLVATASTGSNVRHKTALFSTLPGAGSGLTGHLGIIGDGRFVGATGRAVTVNVDNRDATLYSQFRMEESGSLVGGIETLGSSFGGGRSSNLDVFSVNGSIDFRTGATSKWTIDQTGRLISTLATGTAPFSIASTTKVANLNADLLKDGDWGTPGAIGATVKNSGAFTTLSATGQITSTLSTGTAPIVTSNTTPVAHLTTVPVTYNAAGVQQTDVHFVIDTVALVTGTATVTLVGAAAFTNTATFNCLAKSQAGSNVQEVKNSGSSVTFNGTGTQQIDFICGGK